MHEPLPIDAIQKRQTERQVIRIGAPPLQVDLLTTLEGCEWEACQRNAQRVDIGGLVVPFVGLEDLKAAKRAAGRHRDWDDLEHLP